jgi:hypothetical protein
VGFGCYRVVSTATTMFKLIHITSFIGPVKLDTRYEIKLTITKAVYNIIA